jgi:antitoxin component of MazEF toxin-antitoxin module
VLSLPTTIRLEEKTVGKWGESLVVSLKKEFQLIGVKYQDRVQVEVQDGPAVILIRKVKSR